MPSMHRLPLLAVGYIKIVTHGGLACNCVVASHTRPASLLGAPGPIGVVRSAIHRSAWNRCSQKFSIELGSEVRMQDWRLSATMRAKHAKAPSYGCCGRKGEKYGCGT